MAPFVQ